MASQPLHIPKRNSPIVRNISITPSSLAKDKPTFEFRKFLEQANKIKSSRESDGTGCGGGGVFGTRSSLADHHGRIQHTVMNSQRQLLHQIQQSSKTLLNNIQVSEESFEQGRRFFKISSPQRADTSLLNRKDSSDLKASIAITDIDRPRDSVDSTGIDKKVRSGANSSMGIVPPMIPQNFLNSPIRNSDLEQPTGQVADAVRRILKKAYKAHKSQISPSPQPPPRARSQFARHDGSLEIDSKKVHYQRRETNQRNKKNIQLRGSLQELGGSPLSQQSPKIQTLEKIVSKHRQKKIKKRGEPQAHKQEEHIKLPQIKRTFDSSSTSDKKVKAASLQKRREEVRQSTKQEEKRSKNQDLGETQGVAPPPKSGKSEPPLQPQQVSRPPSLSQVASKKKIKAMTQVVRKSSEVQKELKEIDRDLWKAQRLDQLWKDPLTTLVSLKDQVINQYIQQMDVNAWESEAEIGLSPVLVKPAHFRDFHRSPSPPPQMIPQVAKDQMAGQRRASSLARVQPKYKMDSRQPHRGVILGLKSVERKQQSQQGQVVDLQKTAEIVHSPKIKHDILVTAGGLLQGASPKPI